MKAILMSIRPQYVANILNGEKTIEIRKTYPKCDLPIDVYIYCTKNKDMVCFRPNFDGYACVPNLYGNEHFNGKVVAKFTLNKVEPIAQYDGNEERYFTKSLWETELFEKSCLDLEDMRNYIHNHYGYAWHIDNLEIFDTPKEISEFKPHYGYPTNHRLTRAPQSWQFIEV